MLTYQRLMFSNSTLFWIFTQAPEGVQTSAKKLDLKRKVDGTEESPSFTKQTRLHMG